jgi:hypothetical protein
MVILVEERLRELNGDSKKNRTIGPIRSEILAERMSWGIYIKLLVSVLHVDDLAFTVDTRKDEVKSSVTSKPKRKEVKNEENSR